MPHRVMVPPSPQTASNALVQLSLQRLRPLLVPQTPHVPRPPTRVRVLRLKFVAQ